MAGNGLPLPFLPPQLFTNAGAPAVSHRLFFYGAGTSVKQNTWTDRALTTPNANPIVLDASGECTCFLDPTLAYKVVFAGAGSDDPPTSPIWTRDGILTGGAGGAAGATVLGTAGENLTAGQVVYLSDGSASLTAGRWYKADADQTYSSTTAGAVGFVSSSFNTGTVGAIQIAGQVTGLSGLTAGVSYYISATAGALTATAPGNARLMGIADSTTTLVITPTASGGSVSAASIGNVNLFADPTFLIWPAGDATSPAHWTVAGAGTTIARAGTGLGDTTRKVGSFCLKTTTLGGNSTDITQQLLPTAAFTQLNYLRGKAVSMGAWVNTTSVGQVEWVISDGIGDSSVFHPGDGQWHWLTISRTIDASATELTALIRIGAIGTVTNYFSGPTFVLGPTPPVDYQPAPVRYIERTFHITGAVSAAANKTSFSFARPGIVKDVQLEIITAPTGADLIVDVNTWDGAAYTSMFSTKPKIAAGAVAGGAQPDTTYARKCFTGMSGASFVAGCSMRIDVDQVGSGTAGSDLEVMIRYLSFERPLEDALAYNDYA